VWSIFDQWGVVWAAIPTGIAMTLWFWPRHSQPSLQTSDEEQVA
jgi:hypothetical protein